MCLHYLVKLIAQVLSRYITYFSIQVVNFWHHIFTNCWNNSFQQSTTVSVVGNHAGEGLRQVEDCKCWITWPAHRGRVGTSIGALSTAQWMSGENDCEHVLLLKEDSLNMNWCNSCCNCALWLCRLIVWLLITFAVTVFSVLWLFQSHAAVVKRYNTFCVKLAANSDTEQNNISKSTFPVCVSEHFTFNELWNVTFCHKTRRVCNVWRQNSCDKFCKVVLTH